MPYYLAPYIGAGTTTSDPFRPRSDDPTAAAIDLRPDSSRLDGGGLNACLLWLFTPSSDPNLILVAESEQEVLKPPGLKRLKDRLGVTSLVATRWDQIVLELLMTPPANRWKALRPSRVNKRYEVWLGPGSPLATAPVIAGGAAISENWNCADSTVIDCQLTWTEGVGETGNVSIVSNEVRNTTTTANSSRAQSDLATDDHFVQASVKYVSTVSGAIGICARFKVDAQTYYLFDVSAGNQTRLFKVVAGVFTELGTRGTISLAADTFGTLRGDCDGSTIQLRFNSTLYQNVTDTGIVDNLRCGIRVHRTDGGANALDTWSAEDLGGGLSINVNDAVTIAESVTIQLLPILLTVNDAVTVSEATTVTMSLYVAANDAITVAENVTMSLVSAGLLTITVSDSITVAESVTTLINPLRISVNDAITIGESATVVTVGGGKARRLLVLGVGR